MPDKKVIKKKGKDKVVVKDMSMADLYAMYVFVVNDSNNKGFGATTTTAKSIVRAKQKELEEELYLRTFGFNPYMIEEKATVINGVKPEDIDLDKIATIVKGDVEEPKDEEPKRFVVANKEIKEEKGHVYNV